MNMPSPMHLQQHRFIQRFAEHTGSDVNTLVNGVNRYNRDFSAYGNEVYADLTTRVAHWVNFLEQGWFQHRLDLPLLRCPEFDVVVDLGFSVPYPFASPSLRCGLGTRYLFVDREASCRMFYDALVGMEGWSDAAAQSEVVLADLEEPAGRAQIEQALNRLKPESVLVVASEVIEHLNDPGPVWNWIASRLCACARGRSAIYATLPIGRRIPSHKIEIRSAEDAELWVGRHLHGHRGFVISSPGRPKNPYLEAVYCAWFETTNLAKAE